MERRRINMLSEEQQKIVETVDGRVLVVACPGSGKTTTMLERIHYMINTKNIDPRRILMVTFTKNAADEMMTRFKQKYPNDGEVCFATIHSICFGILRTEFNGLSGNSIMKEWEQKKYFKTALKDAVDKAYLDEAATSLISQISYARNAGLDPYKEYPDKIVLCDTDVKFAPLYKGYENLKHSENKIDFDDMLILTLQLFKQNPVALYRYQSLYDYIIIDEFQDTNKIQANIFYQLSALHGNMCVVGDDDQSIYGFRSADSSIMLNFKKKFKDAQKFTLSTNYRSGKKIVEYAGKVINNNKTRFKKKFEAGREEPGELKMGIYSDELEENLAIIHWIKDLHDKKEVPYCNIAMLYRRNVEATTILPLLKKADISISIKENPGNIHNHFVFEAINAYYQLSQAYDPEEDRISDGAKVYLAKILNCPSRYIKTEFFKDCDLSPKSIKKCINAYFETTPYNVRRYRDMLNNLDELKETLSRIRRMSPKMFLKTIVNVDFEEWVKQSAEYRGLSYEMAKAVLHDIISEGNSFDTMEEWIDYIGDFQEFLDDCANNPDGVRLSTFHGAKGLEWDYVWIRNVTYKNVPFQRSLNENGDAGLEEERRMFYVAFTRAKKEVEVSCIRMPGMFLGELIDKKKIMLIDDNQQIPFSEIEKYGISSNVS